VSPFTLSGFIDEIAPDLQTQLDAVQRFGLQAVDIRSLGGTNVLDLTPAQTQEIREACQDRGLAIYSVGSPVNKVPLGEASRSSEMAKFKVAVDRAHELGTPRIRIFTPEAPEAQHDEAWPAIRDALDEMLAYAAEHGIVVMHENDWKYWGAYPANAKRMFEELAPRGLRLVFDFGNTVLLGYRPMDDWFPWALPYLESCHIKDVVAATGQIVESGAGDGQFVETFRYLVGQGWGGTLSLEPHLRDAGRFGGFSGAERFGLAVEALRNVLQEAMTAS